MVLDLYFDGVNLIKTFFGEIYIVHTHTYNNNNNNIYLLKSLIYIEYNTNSGYKWTPQEVIDLYML